MGGGDVEHLIPVCGDVQNSRISTVEHLYVVGAHLLQIVYAIRYSNENIPRQNCDNVRGTATPQPTLESSTALRYKTMNPHITVKRCIPIVQVIVSLICAAYTIIAIVENNCNRGSLNSVAPMVLSLLPRIILLQPDQMFSRTSRC